jgi:hypothetical protein
MTEEAQASAETHAPAGKGLLQCGLVMPISAFDTYTPQHWLDVKEILSEAVEMAKFKAEIVSYGEEAGIIPKRIVQNLYDNPIVVCDVSGRNPNVMFELGMRLTFDKPTIIVKDNETKFPSDASAIEYLEYPRDLRYGKIVEFKGRLTAKIKTTHEKAQADPNSTSFLKTFGPFMVASLDTKEVSKDEFILDELKEVKRLLYRRDEVSINTPDIIINSATYGWGDRYADVTEAVRNHVANGRTSFLVANGTLGGDPFPNQIKQLIVAYHVGRTPVKQTVPEGQFIVLV